MAYVQIPKDLSNVKTKVALNLTKRQLIGFSVAAFIGIPVYLKSRIALGNDTAAFLMILSTLPVFFIVFYTKDGLTCEKYIKYVYLHEKYQPKIRIPKKEYRMKRKEESELAKKSDTGEKSPKKKKTGRKARQKGERDKKRKIQK